MSDLARKTKKKKKFSAKLNENMGEGEKMGKDHLGTPSITTFLVIECD